MLSLEIITSYNFVIKDKKNEVILESTPFSSFMGCKQSADFQFKELSDEYSVFDEYLYDDNWSEVQASNQDEFDNLISSLGGVVERDNHTYAMYAWFEKEGVALYFEPNFDCDWGKFGLSWTDYYESGLMNVSDDYIEFDISILRGDLVAQKEFVLSETIKEIRKQFKI